MPALNGAIDVGPSQSLALTALYARTRPMLYAKLDDPDEALCLVVTRLPTSRSIASRRAFSGIGDPSPRDLELAGARLGEPSLQRRVCGRFPVGGDSCDELSMTHGCRRVRVREPECDGSRQHEQAPRAGAHEAEIDAFRASEAARRSLGQHRHHAGYAEGDAEDGFCQSQPYTEPGVEIAQRFSAGPISSAACPMSLA